jgi:hypothetical protein
MMETKAPGEWEPSMTKQSFKDSTDINKIIHKVAKGEAISHLAKHGAVYGDFSDIQDLLDAQQKLNRGMEIFEELPGEVKREFNQNPAEFFAYVNDPANVEQLGDLIPGLAAPGNQVMREPRRTMEGQAAIEAARQVDPPSQEPPQPAVDEAARQ